MKLSDLAVETTYCTYCKAWPTSPCRTKSGARATYPHDARTWPIYRAFREGLEDGQRDILGALDSDSSWSQGYIEARRKQFAEAPDGE